MFSNNFNLNFSTWNWLKMEPQCFEIAQKCLMLQHFERSEQDLFEGWPNKKG